MLERIAIVRRRSKWSMAAGLLWMVASAAHAAADSACRIQVVEKESGWPVPLVELRTVSGMRWVSDNAGMIACDAPEIMNEETWFQVIGQGYGVKPDGFGFEGVRLTPRPGETLRVEVERRVIARRIGRLTGSGLFAESTRLGDDFDVPESGVVGCDSVHTAVHNGKRYWIWGDTSVPRYPLGIFHTSCATTPLDLLPAEKPPLKFPLQYFRDDSGRPRGVAPLPGRGPTWLTGLVGVQDAQGKSHLVAMYQKIEPPLSAWQQGLCEWNDRSEQFEVARVLWEQGRDEGSRPTYPQGHAVRWTDPQDRPWLLICNPFPALKIPDSYEAWSDPATWETVEPQEQLTTSDGTRVRPHSGHIAYSPFRKRWVAVFVEAFGKPSGLGEVWYAESQSPLGPWQHPVKILSHTNYTFYNPRIHPELVEEGASYLLFEGTYTILFAGPSNTESLAPDYPRPTPRYEYNQILYRLDLDDDRLSAAQQE